MIKFIVMFSGYVENRTTSALIFQCSFLGNYTGFATKIEALNELALDLYAKYYDDCLSIYENRYLQKVKPCCRESLINDKNAKKCVTCLGEIKDFEFDEYKFAEYIINLHLTTSDTYGEAEQTSTRNLVWFPFWSEEFFGASKEEMLIIPESAEELIIAALKEQKPELWSNLHIS